MKESVLPFSLAIKLLLVADTRIFMTLIVQPRHSLIQTTIMNFYSFHPVLKTTTKNVSKYLICKLEILLAFILGACIMLHDGVKTIGYCFARTIRIYIK